MLLKKIHEAVYDRLNRIYKTYDHVPLNLEAPFIYIQFINQKQEPSKLLEIKESSFYIHLITKNTSSLKVYEQIEKVQEALKEDIVIECYTLINTSNAVLQILEEATNEKHAVLEYKFKLVKEKR